MKIPDWLWREVTTQDMPAPLFRGTIMLWALLHGYLAAFWLWNV